MSGLIIPGSDAAGATQDLIKDQTDKIPRMLSGAIAILGDTETSIPGTINRIQSGAIEILEDTRVTIPASLDRIQSGAIEILEDTGVIIPASLDRIQSGVIEILEDTGVTIPASITSMQTDVTTIKNDTDVQIPASLDRIQSGAIEILEDTGVTIPASLDRIQSGVIEILEDTAAMSSLVTDLPKTVYGVEVMASGVQLTGSDWLDVLDIDPVSYPTRLAAITLRTSGDLIGTAKYRITDDGDVKMFPHVDENILNSGSEDVFTHTVDVHSTDGYKVQVRTTSVDDTSGKTVALVQLNTIELM